MRSGRPRRVTRIRGGKPVGMDLHMPALRTPHLPALRRRRQRRSTKKTVITGASGVLAAIGATWAVIKRRSRATPQQRSADKAKKKHQKGK